MAQEQQAGWVDFAEIKAKVSFEKLLGHFDLRDGLEREGEELTGPCPMCQDKGFRVNLTKSTFSCPGCKKRGSVIDFTSAFKKVGLKEAGVLLKGILDGEASEKPLGSRKHKKRKAGAVKEGLPAPGFDREEVVATLKRVAELVNGLLVKVEG